MLIFDVPVLRSSALAESARLILYTGSQLVRLRDPEYLPYGQSEAKRKKTRQLRILQSPPGVGPDPSPCRLAEHRAALTPEPRLNVGQYDENPVRLDLAALGNQVS